MTLQSPAVGKKLWNFLRVAFFMARKGFTSKRRLIMDMNLMMKRGRLLGKTISKNLAFHSSRHSSSKSAWPHGFAGFGLHEYEFSCSNSPNPDFFHAAGSTSKRRHNYFPCISSIVEDTDESVAAASPLPRIEYSPQYSSDLAAEQRLSPLPSPFSVRISNYSSDDEDSETSRYRKIDDEAEEFIRKFYEQLTAQNRVQLLKYQEMEYQEMLARGT